MAESEGFEPPIDLRLCLISSQVHSTGLCQLSVSFQLFTVLILPVKALVSVVVPVELLKLAPVF
jgi:hypothetical protein